MSAERVVEFFQEARAARRRTVSQPAGQLKLPTAEASALDAPLTLQQVSSVVESLVTHAFDVSGLSKDAAARWMRISPSLLSRQLQNRDDQHLSLQRLYLLPDAFWRELLVNVIDRRNLARVVRHVEGL